MPTALPTFMASPPWSPLWVALMSKPYNVPPGVYDVVAMMANYQSRVGDEYGN